ncbi:hypothetical protein QQ045_020787 [Rhodiola kirilowii]
MSRIEKIPVPLREAIGAKQQESSCSSVAGVPQLIKNKLRRKEPNVFGEVDPVGRDSICEDVVGTWRRKVVDAGALCSGRGEDDDVPQLVW